MVAVATQYAPKAEATLLLPAEGCFAAGEARLPHIGEELLSTVLGCCWELGAGRFDSSPRVTMPMMPPRHTPHNTQHANTHDVE